MYKARSKNDENVARKIEAAYDVTSACDDGNVHIYAKNMNTAEEIVSHFGSKVTSDGVQEGRVMVWFNDEMVNDED